LALNFNQMVASLGNLINNTKHASQVMLENSVAMKNGSNESLQTSESIEIAMKQITKGTLEQTVETEKTANQMNDLAKTIDSVVANANEVELITGFAKELSLKSKEAIHLLTQKARETDEITNTITKNIKEFIASI
jgi:methyl-accepting chemotaxis protein